MVSEPDIVPARTLGLQRDGLWDPTSSERGTECQQGYCALEGGGLWDPTSAGEGNETFFIRVWKLFPRRRVLKTSRGSPKGKTQRGWQYLLAVGLSCYKWYHSQTSNDVSARTLGLQEGGLWDLTSAGEENETFFIRVWKPLPSRRVLKI